MLQTECMHKREGRDTNNLQISLQEPCLS